MRRDVLFLQEMVKAGSRAMELAADVDLDQLLADQGRLESMLWNFTVLGEAAGQVSQELKVRFPEIEWRRPTQLRNRLVHAYWAIDAEIVHTTARDLLPAFIEQVEAVLAQIATEN